MVDENGHLDVTKLFLDLLIHVNDGKSVYSRNQRNTLRIYEIIGWYDVKLWQENGSLANTCQILFLCYSNVEKPQSRGMYTYRSQWNFTGF